MGFSLRDPKRTSLSSEDTASGPLVPNYPSPVLTPLPEADVLLGAPSHPPRSTRSRRRTSLTQTKTGVQFGARGSVLDMVAKGSLIDAGPGEPRSSPCATLRTRTRAPHRPLGADCVGNRTSGFAPGPQGGHTSVSGPKVEMAEVSMVRGCRRPPTDGPDDAPTTPRRPPGSGTPEPQQAQDCDVLVDARLRSSGAT